ALEGEQREGAPRRAVAVPGGADGRRHPIHRGDLQQPADRRARAAGAASAHQLGPERVPVQRRPWRLRLQGRVHDRGEVRRQDTRDQGLRAVHRRTGADDPRRQGLHRGAGEGEEDQPAGHPAGRREEGGAGLRSGRLRARPVATAAEEGQEIGGRGVSGGLGRTAGSAFSHSSLLTPLHSLPASWRTHRPFARSSAYRRMEEAAMSRKASWMAVALAATLGACSSVPYAQRMAQRQAAYAAAAGAPVRSFHYFDLYSWEPLGDSQLAVYAQPNRAWLLDVGPCPNLEFANA